MEEQDGDQKVSDQEGVDRQVRIKGTQKVELRCAVYRDNLDKRCMNAKKHYLNEKDKTELENRGRGSPFKTVEKF